MQKALFVGLAGLLGTLSRYWLSDWMARRFGDEFPTPTLVVNITGCFVAGIFLYFLQERWLANTTLQATVFIGFLGAFTTFSSVGLQTFTLLRNGEPALAALYMVASNLGGLLMVWAGYGLAKLVSS
ncbi:MAG: fluoride efflux transporter CrcB [Pyrinomonadaceae bacterium]|jgi:CrcB protein|nr:fluoride efflux transporter CrcB [Pyrinomonadaceae bacterium]